MRKRHNMQLTKNFTLEELTASSMARARKIDNNPLPVHIKNLERLAKEILQPRFDVPYDADDFSRCVDFYDYCEINQDEDFPKIIERFPFFRPILEKWNIIYGLFKKGFYSQLYEVLSDLRKEVRKIKEEMRKKN